MHTAGRPGTGGKASKTAEPVVATAYTCPMHPEVHEPKPGECPICGMTLQPVAAPPEGGHR